MGLDKSPNGICLRAWEVTKEIAKGTRIEVIRPIRPRVTPYQAISAVCTVYIGTQRAFLHSIVFLKGGYGVWYLLVQR